MSVIAEIEAIRSLIARTASLLDEEDFESWVAFSEMVDAFNFQKA